jgi:hypothetical protein
MSIFIWFLVGIIITIGFVGGYFQIMLFSNLKNKDFLNIFMGAWVANPKNLTEKGKFYRKKIFICWFLIIIMVSVIQYLK